MKRFILLVATIIMAINVSAADKTLRTSKMLSDHMVLQQNANARIWGWAAPGAQVSVTPSWSGKTVSAKAGKDGAWEVFVKTPAGTFKPSTISIKSGGESIKLSDVLIGEVWFFSGQSNMEMRLGSGRNAPVEGSLEEIARSGQYKGLRHLEVAKQTSTEVMEDAGGEWKVCTPANAPSFGAIPYFMGSRLSECLDVPVGVINCSWGGALIECFMSKEILEECGEERMQDAYDSKVNAMSQPMVMYNGMIAPASKYAVNGIVWYQGESNVNRSETDYARRLTKMAELWRKDFGRGDIPFFIIELAPYDYNDGMYGFQDETGPALREQQFLASKQIPNSGYICTNDLVYDYELQQVHPSRKREVGERCCWLALNQCYGFETVQAVSPSFRAMEIKDGKALVYFDNSQAGLVAAGDVVGFEIAGGSGQFHKADVKIGFFNLEVSSPLVPNPMYVRYCFKDFEVGNLKTAYGIPVIPFRSDSPVIEQGSIPEMNFGRMRPRSTDVEKEN